MRGKHSNIFPLRNNWKLSDCYDVISRDFIINPVNFITAKSEFYSDRLGITEKQVQCVVPFFLNTVLTGFTPQ